MKKLVKGLFVMGGFVCVGLGILGILLPILPTTPFLLLVSVCFVKGSTRFDNWFQSTSLYQKYLADFVKHRQMTRRQKWTILLMADAMLCVPFFLVDSVVMRVGLLTLVVAKFYYFFFKIDTIQHDKN